MHIFASKACSRYRQFHSELSLHHAVHAMQSSDISTDILMYRLLNRSSVCHSMAGRWKKCSWFNGSQVKWYIYRSDDADTRSRSRMQLSALMLIIPAPGRVLSSANN